MKLLCSLQKYNSIWNNRNKPIGKNLPMGLSFFSLKTIQKRLEQENSCIVITYMLL